MSERELVLRMLQETEIIATVGFSTQPHKPSHYVPRYLLEHDYRVIPVHRTAEEILGHTVYPDLASIPGSVDMVQLFRPSAEVPPHVEQAIEIGARFLWMQLGIEHQEAANMAREAGLEVIMNRCLMSDHQSFRNQL